MKYLETNFKHIFTKIKIFLERHDIALAAAIVLVLVLISLSLGYSNNGVVPTYPKAHYHYTAEPNNPLKFMSNWDGPDYLKIATKGYTHNIFYANFFPLFPLSIHVLGYVIHSPLACALIIAWFSLIGASYFYVKISKHLFGLKKQNDATKALLVFLLFPSAVFLLGTYSESLYALLALSSIYYALKKRTLVSTILLALCTATHITGIFVVILCGLILLEENERLIKIILACSFGLVGLLSYMYYSLREFKSPLAFIKSQEHMHGWLQHSFSSLITRADPLNVVFIILLITSVLYWWKIRKSFAVYSLLFLLVPIVGRQYGGFNRYVLMAFPVQLMIYQYLKHKQQLYGGVIIIMAVTWTYFALQYMGGYIGN
jgi:hypothetical protein